MNRKEYQKLYHKKPSVIKKKKKYLRSTMLDPKLRKYDTSGIYKRK